MSIRRLNHSNRAVSTVLGMVLMVGIITMSMAVLAAALLSGGLYDHQPRAEFVYQEKASGEVLIGVESVQSLAAGDTRIQVKGGSGCGSWGGSGSLEKGAVTAVGDGSCSLAAGDVIQIVGDSVLLDSYKLRGVSPTYERCSEKFEGRLADGEIEVTGNLKCDIVGEDGGRTDVDVIIDDSGHLDGTVKLNEGGSLNIDGGELTGQLETENVPSIDGGSEINGDMTVAEGGSGDTLQLKSDTRVEGKIHSAGETVNLKDGSEVIGDVTVVPAPGEDPGDGIDLKGNSLIDGDANATEYDVVVGPDATVTDEITENQ
ncbi:hypothetical protein A6E15_19460 [Natrinema saccharevitans]|uniref:Archaeal Type IV pilin N-terminal domain-containing protein n=1 Tax=Natrinema saccharevitans TaxID=301967 RepID=A0A1S8AQL0_9EURY|nr:type IV pilin [Natrinema saccharevitans]OLZ39057.1 hypothetical protein A6E15_19015 [Natrinema saccharevitans]OLZ39143.1 hypothetical protein A6E15_19460 [Natrinema saccharevitans]